jgi:sodium transport system permease protein
MKVMWVVFSKEFLDILRDRRRFIMLLLLIFVFLPFLMIMPYSYLIIRIARQSLDAITIPVQGMEHAPALIAYLVKDDIQVVPANDVQTLVENKEYPVGLIIPGDYEEKVSSGGTVEVIIVTDMRRTMDTVFTRVERVLEKYSTELLQTRLQEKGMEQDFFTPIAIRKKNAATLAETAGSRLGLFIPALIISFGLTAGMSIAVSAIAGEKKKLTLEPVLFTTVNRVQLVMAKLLAVMASVFITLLGMGISFSIMGLGIGLILVRYVPLGKILSSAVGNPAQPSASSPLADAFHFDPLVILLFFLAPWLLILLGAAFQILVSTWARNDEEATTYLMPLSLLPGMTFMLAFVLDDFTPQLRHYAIPILGTVLSMRDLLGNHIDPVTLTVMFGTSALYASLMIALAVWMFHREEVVFRT